MSQGSRCTVDNLPYEILIEIFSYLCLNDLLSAEQVCKRWKDACHDVRTWRNLTYRLEDKNTELVLNCLSRMPKVQGLTLAFSLEGDFLAAVPSKCVYLRRSILADCDMDCNWLRTVQKNCPRIEELQMKYGRRSCTLCLNKVSRLANLKSLATTAAEDTEVVTLKPLADKCSSLANISFGTLRVSKEEIAYFLEKKACKLRQFQVLCPAVGDCILPLLCVCKCLEQLRIVRDSADDNMSGERIMSDCMGPSQIQSLELQNLHTLNSFILYCFNSFKSPEERAHITSLKLFKNLSHLVYLTIHLDYDLQLHLAQCSPLTDYCLVNLPSLCFLEDVSLEGSSIFTALSVFYLSSCLNLQCLNLSQCYNLGCRAMKKLLTLTNLRCLILDECDVCGLPFNLVPYHVRNVTFLSLHNSMCLDMKAVGKLEVMLKNLNVEFGPPRGIPLWVGAVE